MAKYSKYINSTGTHYISNSGSDENGKYSGGKAGDQTGKEWCLRSWYNRPWKCVLRHPNEKVKVKLAELACAAALNNKIGYDQYQRDTYWTQLKAVGYDPAKITVACEADCSKGICDNVRAAGYLLGIAALQNHTGTYTGNMRSALRAAGFQVLTDSKYLTSPDYLLPGDILLNDEHHTATNITKGAKASSSSTKAATAATTASKSDTAGGSLNKTPKWVGKVTASTLNVRTWAGTEYAKLKSYPTLNNGNLVDVCDSTKASDGSRWYYVRIAGKYYGFVFAKYIEKQ